MAEPLVSKIDELAEKLSDDMSRAVSRFVLSGDTGPEAWNRMMLRELKNPLVNYLFEEYNAELVERGLEPVSRERIVLLVRSALLSTSDIRYRILSAPTPNEIVAGGRFSLGTLVGRTHQLKIVSSLIRLLQGRTAEESADSMAGFTGRRRWRTSVEGSRHADLNFVVSDPDDLFTVAPGLRWQYPRQDPTNAEASSNCRCYIEYERVDPISGERMWL